MDSVGISVQQTDIVVGEDDLILTCKPLIAFKQITGYELHHKDIYSNTTTVCTWRYYHENESTIRNCTSNRVNETWNKTFPSGNAILQTYIDKRNVSLGDSGNYSCKIEGVTENNKLEQGTESEWVEVQISQRRTPSVPPQVHNEGYGKNNVIWIPVVSVIALLLIMCVTVGIIIHCRKKRKKHYIQGNGAAKMNGQLDTML